MFSIIKRLIWKKNYCLICGDYRKFKNPKISQIFEKALVLSITCS